MAERTSYTCQLSADKIPQLKTDLEARGFMFRDLPYAHFAAEHSLREADRQGNMNIVVLAGEEPVQLHLDLDKSVAGLAVAHPGVALAAEAQDKGMTEAQRLERLDQGLDKIINTVFSNLTPEQQLAMKKIAIVISGIESNLEEKRIQRRTSDGAVIVQGVGGSETEIPTAEDHGKNYLFIGDDLIDMPVLKRAGFAVAVANAVDEAKKLAHYVTVNKGGRGAVREICDLILKSQDKWDLVTSKYFQ